MKIKSLTLTTSIAVSGIIASGSVVPASAFSIFFGEDIGANSDNSAIPKSIIAKDAFFGKFTGPAPATEGFESFNLGDSAANLNSVGASIQTSNSYLSGVSNQPYNGRFAISGTKYYEVGNTATIVGGVPTNKTTTTLTFNSPIAALGFYATDIENDDGITLQLNNSINGFNTPLTLQRTAAVNTSGSALYYGFVGAADGSETFDSVTFSLVSVDQYKVNDRFGIDNLTVATLSQLNSSATAVPEPLTIVGTLIGGSAALRIRKKLKSSI